MRHKIINSLQRGNQFKREFRRQIRLLVLITLGFTIAFTWRQTVFDASQAFVQFVTNVQDSTMSSILTSTFITLVSITLIYITAHLLKNGVDESF